MRFVLPTEGKSALENCDKNAIMERKNAIALGRTPLRCHHEPRAADREARASATCKLENRGTKEAGKFYSSAGNRHRA